MSILNNILINLYGEEFRRDFEEHLALLKEINDYYRRKRAEIEEISKSEFLYLAITLCHKYSDISAYLDDNRYWSYSEWFKEVFIEDYDKALIEVEQQTNHSDREICLLRIAREAAYRNTSVDTIFKFFKAYDISNTERVIFWMEYYDKR